MLCGLFTYSKEHLCDYGYGKMHKNYLGHQIGNPYIVKIENEEYSGLMATQYMTNGYFVMKITDSTYPAEIRFDLFLNEPLQDVELLIDHLTAPAIPFDGPGIFDYKYSLSHENISTHHLSKFDKKESSYFVNDSMERYENGEWSITLNELEKIKCYFCNLDATRWIIIGAPWWPLKDGETRDIDLPESQTFPVCNSHLGKGRHRERPSDKEKDFWTNRDNQHDLIYDTYDENKEYSYNKPSNIE